MKSATFLILFFFVCSALHADLIGYWSFEDGDGKIAEDLSGSGNHGQLTDTATFTDDGKIGGALDLGSTFDNGATLFLNDAANRVNGAAGFDSIVDTQNATVLFWFNRQGAGVTFSERWFFFGDGGERQLNAAP